MNLIFILLAAGQGRRFGLNHNKLFLHMGDQPLIVPLLQKLHRIKSIKKILMVVRPEEMRSMNEIVALFSLKKVTAIIRGGRERYHSVFQALRWIKKNESAKDLYVAVHDGARLCVGEKLIQCLIRSIPGNDGVIPVLRVPDTIKEIRNSQVERTIPRTHLYSIQTPQVFPFELLYDSYRKAFQDKLDPTDDSQVMEHSGHRIRAVRGDRKNIKLTYPEDLEQMFKKNNRIGLGIDVHAFAPGRRLILGGTRIRYKYGLAGHSDADALTHSLMDAMLGAAGLRDIGHYFPDTDKRYKGADSILLLKQVLSLVKEKGFILCNADSVILAQEPRISPYIGRMKKRLSQALDLDRSRIGIKATTTEKMGFIGKKQGIVCQSIVLLERLEY